MMASRTLLLSFLIAIGACTSNKPSGAVDGPINYRSSGGFSGRGDGSPALRIDVSGAVTRQKPGSPTESAVLDTATLADLHDKILDAEFPALAPIYDCPPCGDDYIFEVSVQLDGTLYTV